MLLTISNENNGQLYGPIEVNDEMTLADLKPLMELDCSFDSEKQELYYNMHKLSVDDSSKTLKDLNIADNSLLLIKDKAGSSGGGNDENRIIEQIRQEILNNNVMRNQLTMQVSNFERILNDPLQFRTKLGPMLLNQRKQLMTFPNNGGDVRTNPFNIPQAEYDRLMSDPDDPVNQAKIIELINQQEIDEQMRNAIEYTPEVFTTVSMLYINLEVNGQPVKAFVDTGAQMTIMSTRLAEKTGLSRLIDRRFIGEARGVGTGKIIGRIHQTTIKIETQYIPCTFTVLDTDMDLLIGLDMLKRHQACINLGKNVLQIANVETRFLNEHEIPKQNSLGH